MYTFAALALATDPASKFLLGREPDTHGTHLFTADVIKMILGQLVCQIVVILVFHSIGNEILGCDHSTEGDLTMTTLVFNAFVFTRSSTRSTAGGSTTDTGSRQFKRELNVVFFSQVLEYTSSSRCSTNMRAFRSTHPSSSTS